MLRSHKPSAEGLLTEALLSELLPLSTTAPSTVKAPELGASIASHPGLQRRRNEDRVALAEISSAHGVSYACVAVCDGVGGSEQGDVASSVAIAAVLSKIAAEQRALPAAELLENAVRYADDEVRRRLYGRGATTICVVLQSQGGDIAALSVGDSRIYAWSPSRAIFQVSVDDTLENELRGFKLENAAVLDVKGLRGSLSQALGEGGRDASSLRLNQLPMAHADGQGLILATDGIWRSSHEAFDAIAKNARTAEELCRRAVAFAAWAGGVDNASIVAIERTERFVPRQGIHKNARMIQCGVWLGDSRFVVALPKSESREEQVLHQRPVEKKKKKAKRPASSYVGSEQELPLSPSPKRPQSKDEIQVSSDEQTKD